MTDYISRADAICEILVNDGIDNIVDRINALPSADAVSEDTQTEERARFVAKETELAHIEARLENAEKRLQGACVANFVAEQLERLKDMTDEERLKLLQTMFPSADAVHGEWTPCGEKMPKELERVNITWLNHNPPFYYQHIKDIPQTDTAVYYRGKWYWWDATVIDVLAEYGEDCNAEQIDKDIEVVAWMPLPTPYKGGDDE